jgi:hypothetical protein
MENNTNNRFVKNNKLVGTWKLKDANLINDTESIAILGATPGGILIFTSGLNFSVIVNNPESPSFVSGDRMSGTTEEYKLAMQNSLALYGTFRVDNQGDF